MPIMIQEIFDREGTQLKLELFDFTNLFDHTCRGPLGNLSLNLSYDSEFLDGKDDLFQIWDQYSDSDGYRGVWIHALGYKGEKFALIGEAGRSGRDSDFAYVTNFEVWKKCRKHVLKLYLEKTVEIEDDEEGSPIVDPFHIIGFDYFYGNRIDAYFDSEDPDQYAENARKYDEFMQVHVSVVADKIVQGEDPAEVIRGSQIRDPYAKFWIERLQEGKTNLEAGKFFREHSEGFRICEIIADAIESAEENYGG